MRWSRTKANDRTHAGIADAVIGIVVISASIAALSSSADGQTLQIAEPYRRTIALLTGLLGAAISMRALLIGGPVLSRAEGRAVAFLATSIVLFCITIEPLGLAVAVMTSAMTASFATEDVKPREAVVFSVFLTALAVLVCSIVLDLDVPVAPFL